MSGWTNSVPMIQTLAKSWPTLTQQSLGSVPTPEKHMTAYIQPHSIYILVSLSIFDTYSEAAMIGCVCTITPLLPHLAGKLNPTAKLVLRLSVTDANVIKPERVDKTQCFL